MRTDAPRCARTRAYWNSANDFVFFARRGELGSNRREPRIDPK